MEARDKLRRGASLALVDLGLQIWSDFRQNSIVLELLPENPDVPTID